MQHTQSIRKLYGGHNGRIIMEDFGTSIVLEWSDGFTLHAHGNEADIIADEWFTCEEFDSWQKFDEYRALAEPPEGC